MAHLYSNFAAAYAANNARFSNIKSNRLNVYNSSSAMWNHATLSEWQNAFYDCYLALNSTAACIYDMANCAATSYDQSWYYESWYWANKDIPSADPTMQQIINAMFLANPTQVTSFVGLMDAYRQSIWNAPFNAEMWAAVARGFMQWP